MNNEERPRAFRDCDQSIHLSEKQNRRQRIHHFCEAEVELDLLSGLNGLDHLINEIPQVHSPRNIDIESLWSDDMVSRRGDGDLDEMLPLSPRSPPALSNASQSDLPLTTPSREPLHLSNRQPLAETFKKQTLYSGDSLNFVGKFRCLPGCRSDGAA
jgi:hypothetical protein